MAVTFQKASRKRVFLKLALTGPSGAGKTYSALELAKGLAGGGPIAVLDTENGSASLYSHRADFDVVDVEPPFAPAKYIEAIRAAEDAGYKVLIIDSFSHAWKYLLDKKEKLDSRGGRQNQYTNWGPVKAEADELKDAILQSRIHIIACMRSKSEYAQENGKVTKVGLAAIQEPDVEYEFTTVLNIAMDNTAKMSKDRTGLFRDRVFKITPKDGEVLLKWLDSAPEQATYIPPASARVDDAAPDQRQPEERQRPAQPPVQPPVSEAKAELHPGSAFLVGLKLAADEQAAYVARCKGAGISPREFAVTAKAEGVANYDELDTFLTSALAKARQADQELTGEPLMKAIKDAFPEAAGVGGAG